MKEISDVCRSNGLDVALWLTSLALDLLRERGRRGGRGTRSAGNSRSVDRTSFLLEPRLADRKEICAFECVLPAVLAEWWVRVWDDVASAVVEVVAHE
jgi:hypothetical protein